MRKFYKQFFPEGIHKQSPKEVAKAEDFLQGAFSDDVSVNTVFPIVEEEEKAPTCDHPKK